MNKTAQHIEKRTWFGKILDRMVWKKNRNRKRFPDISTENFEGIGEFRFSEKHFQSKQDFLTEITNQGKAFRTKGQEDGLDGIHPSAMKRVAENIAELWQSFIESTFRSRCTSAEQEVASATSEYNNRDQHKQFLVGNKKIIENHYRYKSKDFNLGMGVVYLVAALALIAADYPLSKQTVVEGFLISGFVDSNLLALGIVIMTIYIKVIYDEYLGSSVSKTLLEQRKDNLFAVQPEATDAELKKARIMRVAIASAKLIILVLLVITILALGFYRYDVHVEKLISTSGGGLNASSASSVQSQISFVLISLVLPIVGGVCASLGLKRIQNWLERYNINRKNKKAGKRKRRALEVLIKSEQSLREFEEYVDWASSEDFFINCSEYFFSCYLNGYDKGAKMNISTDLYDSARRIRRNVNSLQSTNKIIQLSGESGSGRGWFNEFYSNN